MSHAIYRYALILLAILAATAAPGANVLLVVDSASSLNSEEQARKTSFEGWGHSVTVIEDSDSDTNYNTAIAANDVVYVNRDASTTSVGYRLREAPIGVIWETRGLDDEMGIGTSSYWSETTAVTVTDNTHAVTSGLPFGSLTAASSTQRFTYSDGTTAPGAQVLATVNGFPALIVVDRDARLVNTYNGSDVARGSRVRMPWGSNPFAWTSLTADGLQLAQNAIAWAAAPPEGLLVGQWLFDEASGSTAADGSDYGNDAALYNGATWDDNGLDLDGNDDYAEAPDASQYDVLGEMTLMTWVKIANENENEYQRIISRKIDNWDEGGFELEYNPSLDTLTFNANTGEKLSATNVSLDNNWRHIAVTMEDVGSSRLLTRMYLDGVEITSNIQAYDGSTPLSSQELLPLAGNDEPLSFGRRLDNARHMAGGLRDVRLYSRAVSAEEIEMIADDLIGHWKLDDGSGLTAVDSSPTANDGTLYNSPSWTTGYYNGALEFDGSNDCFLEVPHDDAYLIDEGTISLWVKTTNLSSNDGIFAKDHAFFGTGGHLTLYKDGSSLRIRMQNEGGSSYEITSSSIQSDTWHHVVFTWGSAGMELFLDGVSQGTNSYTGGLGDTSGGAGNFEPLAIGASRTHTTAGDSGLGSAYEEFDGLVDDFRIYRRVVDPGSIYTSDSLIAHWRLDDGSGSTAVDSSGSGHDGSVVGSPPWTTTAVRAGGIDFSSGGEVVVSSLLGEPEDFTVAGWARIDALDVSGAEIINIGDYIGLRVNSSGQAEAFYHHTGSQWNLATADIGFQTGRWFHYAATFDDDADTLSVYVNGELVATETHTQSILYSGQQSNTKLGTHTVWGSYHLQGEMDDVRVYNEALSAPAIAELYGLVGHWKLNEASGTTAADSSQIGANGTHENGVAVNATGLRLQAAEFDGGNDQLRIPSNTAHDAREAFAVAAWVKADSFTQWAALFSRGDTTGRAFSVDLQSDGTFRCTVGSGTLSENTTASQAFASTGSLKAGAWHHVAAMWDGTTVTLYLDGAIDSTHSLTGDLGYTTDDSFIGVDRYNGSEYFDGVIDDVIVYNRAMLPEELAEHLGRVGYWKLDETSGTTAADGSEFAIDGEYKNSPTLGGTAVRGNGADFDGSNDYVRIPSNTTHDCREAVSIAAWIKAETLVNNAGVFTRGISSHATYGLRIRSDGSLNFDGGQGSIPERTAPGIGFLSTNKLTAGQWHQVVGVWDGATVSLYIDGEFDGSTSFAGDPGVTTEDSTIGADLTGGDEYFDGLIDDVVLYNRAMTPEEIAAHYGLVGHYKFDEASGTVAADASPLGNDGEYVNAPTLGEDAIRSDGVRFNASDSDDHIDVPHTALDGATALSVAWWMKPYSTGQQAVLSGANATDSNEVTLYFKNSTTLNAWSSGSDVDHSVKPLAAGRWTQFVYTLDRVTGEERLYRDGELASSTTRTATTTPLSIDVGGLLLGQEQDSVGGGFSSTQDLHATLDDVMLYNRVMTASEIAEHYGLVGYWKLDETSGTTAADSSGLEIDLVHQGTPVWVSDAVRGGGVEGDDSDEFESVDGVYAGIDEAVSTACWFRLDEAVTDQTTQQALVNNERFIEYLGFILQFDQPNSTNLMFRLNDGASRTELTWDAAALQTGRWHQAAGVFDGAEMRLYVDGEQVAQQAYTGGLAGNSSDELDLGNALRGDLDDVVVYNRAMTDEEIAEHYGLIAHYKLDETTGTTANDSGPFANHTTKKANTPVAGVEGPRVTAFDFTSGGSSRVIAPETPELAALGEDNGDFAVALWAKPAATGSSYRTVYQMGETNKHGMPRIAIQGSTNRIQAMMSTSSNWNSNVWSNDGLPADVWTQVVVQKKGSLVEIYIDGERDRYTTWSNPTVGYDGGTLNIGGQHGYTSAGAVDDVRVYNRAMTGREIIEHYGLVGHWRMEETSGSTVSDSSGMGNDGVLSGSGAWSTESAEGDGSLALASDAYVEIPSMVVDDSSDGVTIAGWANLTTADSSGSELISLGDSLAVRLNDPGVSGVTGFAHDGSSWHFSSSSHNAGAGWRHFAAVYDPTDLSVKLYINGVMVDSESMSGPLSLNSLGTKAYIGRHGNSGSTMFFTGGVDDLRVYNRAISADEARSLYYGKTIAGLRVVTWVEAPNP